MCRRQRADHASAAPVARPRETLAVAIARRSGQRRQPSRGRDLWLGCCSLSGWADLEAYFTATPRPWGPRGDAAHLGYCVPGRCQAGRRCVRVGTSRPLGGLGRRRVASSTASFRSLITEGGFAGSARRRTRTCKVRSANTATVALAGGSAAASATNLTVAWAAAGTVYRVAACTRGAAPPEGSRSSRAAHRWAFSCRSCSIARSTSPLTRHQTLRDGAIDRSWTHRCHLPRVPRVPVTDQRRNAWPRGSGTDAIRRPGPLADAGVLGPSTRGCGCLRVDADPERGSSRRRSP